MYISNYDKKQSEQMCFIRCGRLNVIMRLTRQNSFHRMKAIRLWSGCTTAR